MKQQVIIAILILFISSIPVSMHANGVVSGISEFIYGLLYLNIGGTSCEEIVEKQQHENADHGFITSIEQLISTANTLAGQTTVNAVVVREYAMNLYRYCEKNPTELFAKALAVVTRPLFNDFSKQSNNSYRFNDSSGMSDRQKNNGGTLFIG